MALLDRAERIAEVRFFLGGVSTTEVPDSIIDRYLDRNEAIYGTSEDAQCLVIYQTVIQLLKYLDIRSNTRQGDDRGIVNGRMEKVGNITVRQDSDVSGGNTDSGWSRALTDYLNDPSIVCPQLEKEKPVAPIIIGGVSRSQRASVIENNDSFGVYDQSSPFNPLAQQRLLIEGNYYIYRSRGVSTLVPRRY